MTARAVPTGLPPEAVTLTVSIALVVTAAVRPVYWAIVAKAKVAVATSPSVYVVVITVIAG
jgi:hypothetical protein